MKKITKIEIATITLAIVVLGVYYAPSYIQKQQVSKAAKIKADNNAFIQKSLEEFNKTKGIKASKVASIVMDELNETAQNPYDKNIKPYSYSKECKGCTSVETDDSLDMITITTFNKKGDLITRTVIKPPSFVTYSSKEEE